MSFPLQRLRFVAKKNQVTTVAGRLDVPLILAICDSARETDTSEQLILDKLLQSTTFFSALLHDEIGYYRQTNIIFQKDRVRLLQTS